MRVNDLLRIAVALVIATTLLTSASIAQVVDRQQEALERQKRAEQVREATRKGIEYLKRMQLKSGLWYYTDPNTMGIPTFYEQNLGVTALCALALHEADRNNMYATKPLVEKAAAYIRRDAPRLRYTYTVSLCLIFLDRYYRQDIPNAEIFQLAHRLVIGQSPTGGWGYFCNGPASEEDNSNTHFAVLALLLAKRRGAQVDHALKLAEKRFRDSQFPDGGWPYSAKRLVMANRSTPPMTCAGLLGLAYQYRELLKQREVALKGSDTRQLTPSEKIQEIDKTLEEILKDPQIVRARDYIIGRINVINKDFEHVTYFLWSFERIAFIYGNGFFEKLDWYKLGCDILLPIQNETEGYWDQDGRHGPRVDTSFALLFLNRVNLFDEQNKEVSLVSGPTEKTTNLVSGKSGNETSKKNSEDEQALKAKAGNKQEADKLARDLEFAVGPKVDEILERMVEASDPSYAEAMGRAIKKVKSFVVQERIRLAIVKKFSRYSNTELIGYFSASDRELRLAAVETVALKSPDQKQEFIKFLIQRLEDPDSMVKSAALTALKNYSKQNWGPEPEQWKKWWDTAGPAKIDR